jgi:glucan biosynthesis protein
VPYAVIILVKKKRRRDIRYSRNIYKMGKSGKEEHQFVRRFAGFASLASIATAVA